MTLKTVEKKEQYALGQKMTDLNLSLRKLHRENRVITSRTIDQHKEIYDLCCSCNEKYLKILFGIDNTCNGSTVDFKSIKKKPIYGIIASLENSNQNYRLLLKPFSTIIWNADKHTGTLKYPSRKKIEFIANEGRKWMSYSSFVKLTKEICSVNFLLSRYPFAILLATMKKGKTELIICSKSTRY
jgi:hypothetical protein